MKPGDPALQVHCFQEMAREEEEEAKSAETPEDGEFKTWFFCDLR